MLLILIFYGSVRLSVGVFVTGSQAVSGGGAAGRFRVTAASGELRLVQELLNTAALPMNPLGAPDLLDAPDTAAAWFARVGVPAGSPGLRDLQALRDALRQSLVRRDHGGQARRVGGVHPTLGHRASARGQQRHGDDRGSGAYQAQPQAVFPLRRLLTKSTRT